ncbi:TRAP transporter substrate-binding protein [Albimonas pacifica]|uniref:TRAP-type C4-dicarboxylate transport system, substrate-binding protein n=1 Tax=Albimonas pacifica TaxID=1114924 RepID=A0A1I3CUF6_9RHOB|nr:TRAP transporter substrate-binding protein [Albimonas pacifica]SFH78145.1 TRAP-type C4-dicarboxylate transport system, substrate-binding protein [Albimonas pacifica]
MKMDRRLAGLAGLALLAAAQTAPAQAETVLRYSNWLPAGHSVLEGAIKPFIAEVAEKTEGRVTIETLPKVVGTVPGQYDVAVDGLADITFLVLGYTPGRFPLTEVAELPFSNFDPSALSIALWRLFEAEIEPRDEFKGVKVLTLAVTTPSQIATRTQPIESLDQLQGLKMRNPVASFTAASEALGTVPINKPVSEMYELASSGVVDGTFTPLDTMKSFRLMEVMPYMTKVEGGLFQPALGLVMNRDAWGSLSPEDQAVVMAAAGEKMAGIIGAGYAANDVAAEAEMNALETGGVIEASPEMMAALRERLAFVEKAWIEKAEGLGVANAAELPGRLRDETAALSK